MDHLAYDENLYEFMKSLIPFGIATTNLSVNKYLLGGDLAEKTKEQIGLKKSDILNIYYNDTIGKRELAYELLLSALQPKEWGQGEEPKAIEEGQELSAILIDI